MSKSGITYLEKRMKRKDFFNWLDTIIDEGDSDWEVVEDFADGVIYVRFKNIEEGNEDESM